MEIYGSNSNEICYNVKKNADIIEDKDTDIDTDTVTTGTPISFHNDTPKKKSTEKNPDIRELENFTRNEMDSFHKKYTRMIAFICHQLNLQQKEYIKFEIITIDHLHGELKHKQKRYTELIGHIKTLFTFTITEA